MALSTLMCVFFIIALFYSLRKYVKLKPLQNLKQSVETSMYIVVLWFPLAIFIIFKIIFMKNNMDWSKTKHGVIKTSLDMKQEEIKNKEQTAEELVKL